MYVLNSLIDRHYRFQNVKVFILKISKLRNDFGPCKRPFRLKLTFYDNIAMPM